MTQIVTHPLNTLFGLELKPSQRSYLAAPRSGTHYSGVSPPTMLFSPVIAITGLSALNNFSYFLQACTKGDTTHFERAGIEPRSYDSASDRSNQ